MVRVCVCPGAAVVVTCLLRVTGGVVVVVGVTVFVIVTVTDVVVVDVDTGAGRDGTLMDRARLAVLPVISATCTVKLKVPDAVGAPVIVPVAVFRESPLGNAPELTHQV